MATQKKILQRVMTATVGGQTISGGVGTLALGKPGDVLTTAYGPVVRAAGLTADANFGAYVSGKGVLVNSGDCAAIGTKFDTVAGLKSGQVGSFLISGACVVYRSQINAIAGGMKVQYVDADAALSVTDAPWVEYAAWSSGSQHEVGAYVSNGGNLYKVKQKIESTETSFPTAKCDLIGTLYGTSATFSAYGDYTKAFCQVTHAEKNYSNLEPIMDGVFAIEVNGFDNEAVQ